jgi:hypothetical protein
MLGLSRDFIHRCLIINRLDNGPFGLGVDGDPAKTRARHRSFVLRKRRAACEVAWWHRCGNRDTGFDTLAPMKRRGRRSSGIVVECKDE